VHLANEVIPLNSHASTVAGFLDELSISLPQDAFVDPPINAALNDGMSVFLEGLSVTRGISSRTLPATVEIVESWHSGPEQLIIDKVGRDGLVESTCTVFFLNGHEVGRRQHDKVLRAMQPTRVVHYQQLTSADGPSVAEILDRRMEPSDLIGAPARWRDKLTMKSTAYEPGPQSCGKWASGYTANGTKAGYGVVAVDPSVIPLGTRLFIEGYGYAVAADTGGAIDAYDIDLCFLTVDECFKWGRKDVTVYVLY
jgi:3D (Asp-Asp-Asp) domain-containing protein